MFKIFGKEGYIFTDKKNPKWGIMSSILGLIAGVSVCLAVHLTYLNGGTAGLALGIRSLTEKDIFRVFPIIGILLNVVTMAASGIILYLGVS